MSSGFGASGSAMYPAAGTALAEGLVVMSDLADGGSVVEGTTAPEPKPVQ